MKHVITAVIAVACIILGAVGGHFLKTAGAAPSSDAQETPDETEGKSDKSAKDSSKHPEEKAHGKKADGKGKDKGLSGNSDTIYFKFSREFVVPIIRNERVESLVILNLNIEADADISQQLFSMEPKLRDNIMSTLITLSNDGTTFESITDVESYESVRALVLMNLRNVVASGIRNVLIVDMARQDL